MTSRSTHSFVVLVTVLAGCSATNLSRDACEMSEPPGKAPDPRVAPPWRRVPRPDKPDASAPRAAWPCVADCWRFQPGPSPVAGGALMMSCHISCAVLPELEVSPLTFDAVIRAERPDDRPPPRLPCLDRGAPSPRPRAGCSLKRSPTRCENCAASIEASSPRVWRSTSLMLICPVRVPGVAEAAAPLRVGIARYEPERRRTRGGRVASARALRVDNYK